MADGQDTRERDTFDESAEEVRQLMASAELEGDAEDIEERGAALLGSKRRIAMLAAAVALMIVAIYFIFPKIVGVTNAFDRLDDAPWYWLGAGGGVNDGAVIRVNS